MDELSRLATFTGYPSCKGLYPSLLAHEGFMYTGKNDEVICINCRINAKPHILLSSNKVIDKPLHALLGISRCQVFLMHPSGS